MIRFDCRHHRAARPCDFNKLDGSECPACTHVAPFEDRVLFIKLDAIGDVLRTASLLPAVAARHRRPFIAWATRPEAAELVGMMALVDEVIPLAPEGLARIATGGWTQVYSLSNDAESAALATLAAGTRPPVGFHAVRGVVTPSNDAARAWLEMAAFDRLKRANTATYQARMLAILGAAGPPPRPALRLPPALHAAAAARVAHLFGVRPRRLVAINLGAGTRWPKKMLDSVPIARCIQAVCAHSDAAVLLVGGAGEQAKAEAVRAQCDPARVALALTPEGVGAFVAMLAQADALLCGDTLALHVATAIGLPAVAVFGPTSHAEIEDFGGLIDKVFTRALDCLCCYGDCTKTENCMTLLDPADLAQRLLARLPAA